MRKLVARIHFVLFLLLFTVPWGFFLNTSVDLSKSMLLPSLENFLGTDHVGRSLFLRINLAFWQGVVPVWASSFIGFSLAICFFLMVSFNARMPRFIRPSLKFFCLSIKTLPTLIVILFVAAYLEVNNVYSICFIMFFYTFAKIFIDLEDLYTLDKQLLYWQYHKAAGGQEWQRIWKYGIAGKWKLSLILVFSLALQTAVILEASVSYLGMGVSEPSASFGGLISSVFADALKGHVVQLFIITLALFMTVYFPKTLYALTVADNSNS